MCHHCCIETVKKRMLSRRQFFGAAAATTAAVALPPSVEARSLTVTEAKPVDLTHELYPDFPTYFGEPQLTVTPAFTFAADGFNGNTWTLAEHTGTHMDAPLHFSEDGQSVAEVPVGHLVVPLSVIDIRDKAVGDPDAQVTPDDITAWKAQNGPLPDGGCVAMNSGWDAHVATAKFRNAGSDGTMHFPGFHLEAAQMLMEESTTIGIGVDTLSLDYGPSGDFATHYAWLPTNRWGLEALANLGALPAAGATLIVGAPKVRAGTGGPCRVFALAA